MHPAAAYFVMVATEESRKAFATPQYQVMPPKKTRSPLASVRRLFGRPVRQTAASAA